MKNFLLDCLPSELAKQIFQKLPKELIDTKSDFEQELKEIIKTLFSKLDLVTREEFDIQTKVLQATRARVEALEKQLIQP